jgi:hypothetical protein
MSIASLFLTPHGRAQPLLVRDNAPQGQKNPPAARVDINDTSGWSVQDDCDEMRSPS